MRTGVVMGALFAVSLAGCGDDGPAESSGGGGAGAGSTGGSAQTGGGGAASGGGGAAASVESCDQGATYVEPDPSLSGTSVTLSGTTRRAPNIVQVGSADCTEGLNAALLEALDDGTDVLLKSGNETIFCGCPEDEHALCARLGEDAARHITGALTYADTTMCNQVPCYELDVVSLCEPSQ